MADTIRQHLSSKHGNEWCKIVVLEKLKGWDKVAPISGDGDADVSEPFTTEGFLDRLVRWIVADDQVSLQLRISLQPLNNIFSPFKLLNHQNYAVFFSTLTLRSQTVSFHIARRLHKLYLRNTALNGRSLRQK